jgi:hypothetical protein
MKISWMNKRLAIVAKKQFSSVMHDLILAPGAYAA